MKWKKVANDGQLSIDDMDVAPIEVSDRVETLDDKIEQSYKKIRLAAEMSRVYYNAPLIVCYSGGKDSDVLLQLCDECLEPGDFEVLNSHTTVDAPQTVKHIEKVFARMKEKGVKTVWKNRFPVKKTMWELIAEKGIPPTRIQRYCCAELKETGTPNRLAALGVRGGESQNRRGRETFGIRGGYSTDWYFFRMTTPRRCIANHRRFETRRGTAH